MRTSGLRQGQAAVERPRSRPLPSLPASGAADASAIDSNALAIPFREDPELARKLRVLETWGPLRIQPLIAARALGRQLPREVAAAVLTLDRNPRVALRLPRYGFTRFAPVEPAFCASFPSSR
jgi:hypothetical protein